MTQLIQQLRRRAAGVFGQPDLSYQNTNYCRAQKHLQVLSFKILHQDTETGTKATQGTCVLFPTLLRAHCTRVICWVLKTKMRHSTLPSNNKQFTKLLSEKRLLKSILSETFSLLFSKQWNSPPPRHVNLSDKWHLLSFITSRHRPEINDEGRRATTQIQDTGSFVTHVHPGAAEFQLEVSVQLILIALLHLAPYFCCDPEPRQRQETMWSDTQKAPVWSPKWQCAFVRTITNNNCGEECVW